MTSRRDVARSAALACALAASACQTTVDSLGYNDATGIVLHPMRGPASYQNAFRDLLGKSSADIEAKLASAYAQLFHGDPDLQAIYFPVSGQPQAFIRDVLHDDIRTEGIGLGMIISLELDKRDELDRLWTYAKTTLEEKQGSARGYFKSSCRESTAMDAPCFDPYGMEYMLMALLLANDRWGTEEGGVDYATGAKELLTVMRHKQDENGGIADGLTDTFDSSERLPFSFPLTSSAGKTRPSIVTPGFYDMWSQAAADPFWSKAASAGRRFWKATAHPKTGLVPLRSQFDGSPDASDGTFGTEAYRTFINVVIDRIWSPTDDWDVQEADRVLGFFLGQGFNVYGRNYQIDGTPLDSVHEPSLVMTNGITGLVATIEQRSRFIAEVWDLDLPVGPGRYYTGILQMVGLLILSGELRVY